MKHKAQNSAAIGHDDLLVADSFRVRGPRGQGQVRGFPLHLARFRDAAIATAADLLWPPSFRAELEAFLMSAPGRISAAGEGFPRLELWSAGRSGARDREAMLSLTPTLKLRLRPLPTLNDSLELRTVPDGRSLPVGGGDPAGGKNSAGCDDLADDSDHALLSVRRPDRKGPRIALYAALREELGAEPLLLDEHGMAVEGGTTSLLWWRGTKAYVSASTARVDSVTERLVGELLVASGMRVEAAMANPAELATTEVWALNALHGIRTVRSIDDQKLPAPDAARLARARAAFEGRWRTIT